MKTSTPDETPNDPMTEDTTGDIPESPTPTHEDIAALAYELWEKRGSSDGSQQDDWRQAEAVLRTGGPRSKTASA